MDEHSARYNRAVRLAMAAGNDGLYEEAFLAEMKAIQRKLAAARQEPTDAEEFATSREIAWERLSAVIDETRNLAATWASWVRWRGGS